MQRIFGFLFLVVITFSCKHDKRQVNNGPSEGQKNNVNVVNQYFKHFNGHDWQKMAELYQETALFKDPSIGNKPISQSHEEIVGKYSTLNEVIPDLHDEVIEVYPSGDKNVIVEFVSTGTTPDGNKFELPICTIFTIENGKISKDFTYYDNFDESGE
ncbi:nuclear transport factor 2 family protein [Aureibacter tunicatorum]|uniref:Ketosteroid isomerase-like protein n=1 Tax=Aureibacter tunicatorum TaxID=866807 RepID=A0AAE3XRL9_9BACT|nr:nuclear transport factor 2 family protein [Aureibacter tunicatorum]MDR6241342.1 ketosteroid isomerase-like protein [Aureibacter tunicatorum]BDD03601.1 hypothetical protein AUTU_10840 [Aureibacter tunicatorum]